MFNFDFGGMGGGGGHSHGGGRGGRAARAEVDTTAYYIRLGVEKTATEAEIKKAFRKQAMTHHPDRGGNADTFKELNKAYEALSDPQKRALYDEGGEEALADGAQGGGGAGMGDIFDMFGGGMFGGGRGRGAPRVRKGEDVNFPLKVTLEDCYNGCAKKLRLTKNVICQPCGGKGGKGGKETKCPDCKGQGARMVIRQIGPGMIQQAQVTCAACKGSGSQIADKDRCPECQGQKTIKEKKTLEIHVTKGMAHGAKIVFSGEADQAPDQVPGDVVVILQQVEHATFRRDGPNLFHKHTLTLLEALTGFSFPIQQLDGRTLLVKSDAQTIVRPGDVKAIKDEGMPQVKNPYVRGHLYVEFDVVFPEPKQLSESSKKILRSVLPPAAAPTAAEAAMNDNEAEVVTLVSVDMEAERKKFQAQEREAYADEEEEEDEEGHGGRGGQPQCRQQ